MRTYRNTGLGGLTRSRLDVSFVGPGPHALLVVAVAEDQTIDVSLTPDQAVDLAMRILNQLRPNVMVYQPLEAMAGEL